jgi:arylsulfatase A-like enzyme
MMDDYFDHRRHGINYMRRNQEEIDPEGHATDLFTDWAVEYLRQRAERPAQPFFLYLAYNAHHTPIQPPEEWLIRVKQREPGIDERRARLVALIEHLDDAIGRVLEQLRLSGLEDDTLVVFTSDNGGQLSVGANNGPLRDGKQSVYEGGLKVPACVVWPGRIEAGTRCAQPVLTMDLYPTLCAAAGVAWQHRIEGRSFLPALRGESQPWGDRLMFFHRREGGERYGGLTINAVRRGPWKLLQNSPFAPLELYHLEQDPREQLDLSQTERQKFRELSAALRLQVQRGGAVPWQPPERAYAE